MDLWHWLLLGVAVIGLIYLGYSFYPILRVLRLESKAAVLMNAGQPDKAEALLRRAVRLAESRWDAPNTVPVLLNLASAIYLQEKYSEADSIATRMLELAEETYGPSHTLKAAALMTLLQARERSQNPSGAKQALLELRAVLEQEESDAGYETMREELRQQLLQWDTPNDENA